MNQLDQQDALNQNQKKPEIGLYYTDVQPPKDQYQTGQLSKRKLYK